MRWKGVRPSLSLYFFIMESLDGLEVSVSHWIVLYDFVVVIFPVSFIKGPETVSESTHDRFDKRLIGMITKECLEAIYVERGCHLYVIAHGM